MKKLLTILCILFTSLCFSQLSNSNKQLLEKEVLRHINVLRQSKKLPVLTNDTILHKAAVLHSGYMAKTKRLSHSQHTTRLKRPIDRVNYYSDEYELIGENILHSKPVTLPLSDPQIKRIALEIFRSWKGSPNHYKNLTRFSYSLTGLGFKYQSQTKRIYATQVFGIKGIKIPKQLSDNAFGVKLNSTLGTSCSETLRRYSNILINMGNAVAIDGDEILFKYHDNQYLREIFSDSNDGMAIDLLVRDQFSCNGNSLDMSKVYDGVMLKPVYRDELFNNNKAKSDYRFIVSLGKIPKNLLGKNISASLIFIKDKSVCEYRVPVYLKSDGYDLIEIKPSLRKPKVEFPNEGINKMVEVVFDFDTGKMTPTSDPKITFKKEDVVAIDIQSFTSVEGTKEINEELHHGRAAYIEAYLTEGIEQDLLISKEAKENWALCEYQMELFGKSSLLNSSKAEIRRYVQNNLTKWKEALKRQRRSKAMVYLKGTWNAAHKNKVDYNLLTAIVTNNIPLINRCLAEMYENDMHSAYLNNDLVFSKVLDHPDLVENISAILLKNFSYYYQDDIIYYIRNWLKKPENLSVGAQENLLNLYAITTQRLLKYWDVDSKTLAKVMNPARVDKLLKNYKGKTKIHPLVLNFHIATIKYYGQINDSRRISTSFDFITNYFKEKVSNINDEIKLCLFFNSWSMYRYTTELLVSRMDSRDFNEEAAFLLAQNISSSHSNKKELVAKVHAKAYRFNKTRWCKWINSDFQLLRNDTISSLYCKTCQQ